MNPYSRTGTMATHWVLQVSRRRELTRHMSSSREAVQGKSSRSHNSLGVNSREDQTGAACHLRRRRSLWRQANPSSRSRAHQLDQTSLRQLSTPHSMGTHLQLLPPCSSYMSLLFKTGWLKNMRR